MNREKAKHIIRKAHFNIDDPNREGEIAVDKIFDDFESRTCGNCKYWTHGGCDLMTFGYETRRLTTAKDFGCNKWEAKDAK